RGAEHEAPDLVPGSHPQPEPGARVVSQSTPNTIPAALLPTSNYEEEQRVTGGLKFHDVTEVVSSVTEEKTPIAWYIAFAVALGGLGAFGLSILYLIWAGTGIWGLQQPVGWGWAIVNFVFWVGIGHAGTLISAILFLFRQKWR